MTLTFHDTDSLEPEWSLVKSQASVTLTLTLTGHLA